MFSRPDLESIIHPRVDFLDEIYRKCTICKEEYLYCYWDEEIGSYIYLTKEHENACSQCRHKFIKSA